METKPVTNSIDAGSDICTDLWTNHWLITEVWDQIPCPQEVKQNTLKVWWRGTVKCVGQHWASISHQRRKEPVIGGCCWAIVKSQLNSFSIIISICCGYRLDIRGWDLAELHGSLLLFNAASVTLRLHLSNHSSHWSYLARRLLLNKAATQQPLTASRPFLPLPPLHSLLTLCLWTCFYGFSQHQPIMRLPNGSAMASLWGSTISLYQAFLWNICVDGQTRTFADSVAKLLSINNNNLVKLSSEIIRTHFYSDVYLKNWLIFLSASDVLCVL